MGGRNGARAKRAVTRCLSTAHPTARPAPWRRIRSILCSVRGPRWPTASALPSSDRAGLEIRRTVVLNLRQTHSTRTRFGAIALAAAAVTFAGCGGGAPGTPADAAKTPGESAAVSQTPPATAEDAPLPPPAFESGLPEAVRSQLGKTFTGDFDGMVARRMIRVGVTFNRTFYFVDNGVQRGLAYEFGKALRGRAQQEAQDRQPQDPRRLRAAADAISWRRPWRRARSIWWSPRSRSRPELQKLVDFTDPTRTQRQRGRRDGPSAPRSPRPTTCPGGRSSSAGRQLLREPGRAQRDAEGEGQGARRAIQDSRATSRTTTCSRWSTRA